MSEWNVIRENFHTKHRVLTAPDEHMPYIIQLHIMSIRWAYYEQMKQQNIWPERERENSELYYTRIKILGTYLFLQSVCVCVLYTKQR